MYAFYHPRDWKTFLPHENDMEGLLLTVRKDGGTGAFAGDDVQRNAAHAPWAWDDKTDGSDLQAGVIATDPAYLVSQYFSGLGTFSLTYVRNAYRA
ncbi:hypothetical protein ACQEVZ_00405 [Dactylosporangium sp. CA-152071]|uniref:hypothetical protein n=1 Tax=Dactylosporangium sp. CA-152071 TaxID=3239933 RepID=UPI003D94C57F